MATLVKEFEITCGPSRWEMIIEALVNHKPIELKLRRGEKKPVEQALSVIGLDKDTRLGISHEGQNQWIVCGGVLSIDWDEFLKEEYFSKSDLRNIEPYQISAVYIAYFDTYTRKGRLMMGLHVPRWVNDCNNIRQLILGNSEK